MDKLLQSDYIAYLKNLNANIASIGIYEIRSDVINDTHFDIQDLKPTIKQSLGTGSVTYNNPNGKIIAIIDYEDFLNKQPQQPEYSSTMDVIKALGLKKPDFILYDLGTQSFFILNELSQSKNPKNKRKDAMLQLHNALMHFLKVPVITSFIGNFTDKKCIFSNRYHPVQSPNALADPFGYIQKLLQPPVLFNYQPITKLGFSLIETNVIKV